MNYIDLIKIEFANRRVTNPFYSLRQFAKDLGLNPMHLSNIMKGKRGLSKNNAHRVGKALGMLPFEAQRFSFLVSEHSGRGIVERNAAKQGLRRPHLQKAKSEFQRKYQKYLDQIYLI